MLTVRQIRPRPVECPGASVNRTQRPRVAPAAKQHALDLACSSCSRRSLVCWSAAGDPAGVSPLQIEIKDAIDRVKRLEDNGVAFDSPLYAAAVQAMVQLQTQATLILASAQGRAAGAAASAGDEGRLYSGVTLYVLSRGLKGYSPYYRQRTTRKQLQEMWEVHGYVFVIPVDSKPAQLLTLDTCPDCTDMSSVPLEDGIQLAVVMHQPMTFMGLLQDKVMDITKLAEEQLGFKDNIMAEPENAAAGYALEQIKMEPGARVFGIKEVAKAVELDGAAYSDLSVVIVEHKETFRYSDLENFVTKLEKLKKLIELGAANTELLQGKTLRAYAMAGSWSGSTDEQAAMVRLMEKHEIQPVMPDGSGYQISWGCNPHRPGAASSTETEACETRFLETRQRVKSAQPAMLR